jgi:HKD family nuclease
MEIKFIDNQEIKLSTILNSELKGSIDSRLAVAFVSNSGLALLEASMLDSLSTGGQIEMLVGLDFTTTEATALWKLHKWSKESKNFRFYCLPLGSSTIYHPKMYLMSNSVQGAIIVGSSNLTMAGLAKNAEANIFIKDKTDSEVFTDAQASYIRLKFDGRRIPNEEFLSAYERKSKEFASSKKKQQTSQLKTLFSSLQQDFSTLPIPAPTRKDLVGWLKLVYEVLPEGDFANDEVYKNEDYFESRYPLNRNIRAKSRQQLQILRDIGLLESVSRGVWRKKQRFA